MNIERQEIMINPILSPYEMHFRTCLKMNSHTDTRCVNKYTFIESVVEGMIFDAVPFDETIVKLSDLPICNAIYAYENPNIFCTILLQINYVIYIKDKKHALMCPKNIDYMRTGTLTITAKYYNFYMEQYGPTEYIDLRRPSEE